MRNMLHTHKNSKQTLCSQIWTASTFAFYYSGCFKYQLSLQLYLCKFSNSNNNIFLSTTNGRGGYFTGQWADSFYFLPDFVYSGICIFIWLFEDIQMAICVLIPTYCRLADKGRKENSGKLERRRGNPNVAEHCCNEKNKGRKGNDSKEKCGCGCGGRALTLISGAVISHRHHLSVISHRQPFHPSSLIIYGVYVSVEHCFSTFTFPELSFCISFVKELLLPLMTRDIHLFHPN